MIAEVLEHIDTGPVDVLGHSMGGTVGLQLALDRPGLVRRLLVAEGNLDPGGGALSLRVATTERSAFINGGFDELLDDLRVRPGHALLAQALSTADPAGVWGNADALVNVDPALRSRFLDLRVPRTFVYGEKNVGTVAPDVPDPAPLAAAGVRIAVVPEAGHSMMVDNPAGFADVVADAFSPVHDGS